MVKRSHLGTKPRNLEITVQDHIHVSKFDKKDAGQAIGVVKLAGLSALDFLCTHLSHTCFQDECFLCFVS